MGKKDVIRRICEGMPEDGDLLHYLSDVLSPADLQSLLMEVHVNRVLRLAPQDVLSAYRTNRFVRPSLVSPVMACEIDAVAYSLLPAGFTAIEISPLSPFGCASTLGPVHQNKIVTATRNTEVCSDVTNYLALECAVRRREILAGDRHSFECVKMCASQRQVRSQPFEGPNSFAHFRVLALCTAGHDEGNFQFEQKAATEHISFYLDLLRTLACRGSSIHEIELETVLFDTAASELESNLRDAFQETLKQKIGRVERLDQNYYQDIGFHIFATNNAGEKLFLADGGFTDWTQKLLGNRKERLLTSGIGTERLAYCFK
jgi:hypothetical protein